MLVASAVYQDRHALVGESEHFHFCGIQLHSVCTSPGVALNADVEHVSLGSSRWRLFSSRRGNLSCIEPTTEIGQKRVRRAKWFFTFQIGGVVVVMALLGILAVVNISEGEDTAAWVALLIAEPVVLALLLWLARRAVKDAER